MSTFKVEVRRIQAVEPIAGADRIELAVVAGWRSVVPKGSVRAGSPAVYIPEAAVVPEAILRKLGLWDGARAKGKLAGDDGRRVKAVSFLGVLSQGLILPVEEADGLFVTVDGERRPVGMGEDVGALLGIVKYEPDIPETLRGAVVAGWDLTEPYDIENLKAWPDAFRPGEPVVAREKIHGVFAQFGEAPGLSDPDLFDGDLFVTSKGLAGRGLMFKNAEENAQNVYVTALGTHTVALRALFAATRRRLGLPADTTVRAMGEIFGADIQDLGYGLPPSLRLFDVHAGPRGQGAYLDDADLRAVTDEAGFLLAPELGRFDWSQAAADALLDGPETVSGIGAHLREGIVVRPLVERRVPTLGRLQLKHVSPAYLLRKGGTEYS